METRNWTWFALGCGLALLLVGLVMVRPLRLWAEDMFITPFPTATPKAGPLPTWTPRPQPTLDVEALVWQRDGDGVCQNLTVSQSGAVYYHRCAQGAILGELTDLERAALDAYRARLEPMVFGLIDDTGAMVDIEFPGQGDDTATARDQREIAVWAQQVFERLERDDTVANLVARTRVDLAGRLGISADGITTQSVVQVVWPDDCLGIERSGVACAEVETKGLLVTLQAGAQSFEYHTDLEDTILLVDGDATTVPSPTAQSTTQPTTVGPTLWPTATPWPTATLQPTPQPTWAPMPSDAWRTEYFDNASLAGQPVIVRNEDQVRYDWGDGGPVAGFVTDYWSARWSRSIWMSEGDYNWKLRGDDGVRLWVDGVLIINRWHGGYTDDVIKRHMGEGWHDVAVEYFELTGAASIRLTWEKFYDPKPPTRTRTQTATPTFTRTSTPTRTLTPTRTATATPTAEPAITGWRGEYYAGLGLSGEPAVVRDDPLIAFDWGQDGLPAGISSHQFSVRWTRTLALPEGAYRFMLQADGAVEVRVNGSLVIATDDEGQVIQAEGWRYLADNDHDIRVDYAHSGGEAQIHFWHEAVTEFSGWRAEYYHNRHLSGMPFMVVDEPTLNHGWGRGAYALSGIRDNFSARWSQTVALAAAEYRFSAMADDGVRVYVNGDLMIDEWHRSPGRWYHKTIDVNEDGPVTIIVEYYEASGHASVALTWELLELIVPTATETFTPFATSTPTFAPSSTATHTPTVTDTPVPTSTPTGKTMATAEGVPTNAATSTPTATVTGTPPTPTVTGTPATPTPIIFFRPTRKPRSYPTATPTTVYPDVPWFEHGVTQTTTLKNWWLDLLMAP